jgi:hypothetical protein
VTPRRVLEHNGIMLPLGLRFPRRQSREFAGLWSLE